MGHSSWDLRLVWAAAGLAWFVWLGLEDQGLGTVFAVASLVCLAIGLTVLRRHDRGTAWIILVGLLSGSVVPLMATVLMFLKVSLHGHPVPDFTLDDVWAALGRTPYWVLAGLLAGTAAAILRDSRRR